MRFNAKKFAQHAEPVVRKQLSDDHRQMLDGMQVTDGQIDYTVDGEEYYLYPVLLEWCDQKERDKQIPMEVDTTIGDRLYGGCPVCGRLWQDKIHVCNYCDGCGQKLKLPEEET